MRRSTRTCGRTIARIAEGSVQPAYPWRHAGRPDRPRYDVLLWRLSGHAHGTGAVRISGRAHGAHASGNLIELSTALTNSAFIPAGCVDTADKISTRAASIRLRARFRTTIRSPTSRPSWPTPACGSFGNPNYISNAVLNTNIDQFDVRIDHTFGSGRDQLFGRYSFQDAPRTSRRHSTIRSRTATSQATSSTAARTSWCGWSKVIDNSLLNEFRGAWNWIDSDVVHTAFGMDVNGLFGIRACRTIRASAVAFPSSRSADVHTHRGTVLPAAVPEFAGLPVRRQSHLDEIDAHVQVRRRTASRHRRLYRPAVAQRLDYLHDGRYSGPAMATFCSASRRGRA